MQEERRSSPRYAFDATAEAAIEGIKGASAGPRDRNWTQRMLYADGKSAGAGQPGVCEDICGGEFFRGERQGCLFAGEFRDGIQFRELKPYFVGVLKKWLLEAMVSKQKPRD
jgi:hypothetical protein